MNTWAVNILRGSPLFPEMQRFWTFFTTEFNFSRIATTILSPKPSLVFFLGQPYQGDVAINVQGSRAPPTDRVEGHTKITVALAVVYFRILRVYDHDGTLIEDLSRQSHGQDPRTTAHGV